MAERLKFLGIVDFHLNLTYYVSYKGWFKVAIDKMVELVFAAIREVMDICYRYLKLSGTAGHDLFQSPVIGTVTWMIGTKKSTFGRLDGIWTAPRMDKKGM